MTTKAPLVLIIVQNLALPGDRRVWLECQTLRDAGYRVAAITPKGNNGRDPGRELHEGVHLYKYKAPRPVFGAFGYLYEFIYCWLATMVLSFTVMARHGRPAVLQACNPPDTYFALAWVYRTLGTKFIYDQHDLCPELFESRFGRQGTLHTVLRALERRTYRAADHVISTNQTYRNTAIRRGRLHQNQVTVVRTGPDTDVLTPREPRPELKHGRQYLVHFHGVMGPQDSVEIVIETAKLFAAKGRTDTYFNILGSGDMWATLKQAVTDARVEHMVYMPGRVSDDELFDSMSTATIGLSPDLPGPLNNVSTMNKTMEYMAFGLPGVAFDLTEARVSAGESATYVSEPTAEAYAWAVMALLDDPQGRATMSAAALERARTELCWPRQATAYLRVYNNIIGPAQPSPLTAASLAKPTS